MREGPDVEEGAEEAVRPSPSEWKTMGDGAIEGQ